MAHRPLVALILTVFPVGLAAQQSAGYDLRGIMRGPETVGREPSQLRWSPDGRWIYFSWLPPGTDWRENTRPYRIRAEAGATPEPLTEAHADSVAPQLANGVRTRDDDHDAVVDSFPGDYAR